MALFKKEMEPLSGDKLRGIAGAARELKSEKFSVLLYKWIDIRLPEWIDQSLEFSPETGKKIAREWTIVGWTYREQRKLFDEPLAHRPADDGDITECVIASRGQVEARFLARWAQYMDADGMVPQPNSHHWRNDYGGMHDAFQEAYFDWVAAFIETPSQRHTTQALFVLPKLFDFLDYEVLKVHNAAKECQKICSLLGVEHDDLAVLVEDTPRPRDSHVWLRLGSIYIDACIHVAGLPIEANSEQMYTRYNPQAPHQYLRRALCCFSHGQCEKLPMYRGWFDRELDLLHQDTKQLCEETDDDMEIGRRLNHGYAEIGRGLRDQAKRRRGCAAVMQKIHMYGELLGHRGTARGENVQEGVGQVRTPDLRIG